MVAGPALMAVGCGLLYSVKATDSVSLPKGYSALVGFGCGMVFQNVLVSVLTELFLRFILH
jgi:hypothetical protein